jgi:hypothetical protein
MANYTKGTNFATKDTLPTGDSGKIVKGTEIDSEFNAIASAISSKADTASPTFTGTPAAPTATAGTNTTQLATTAFVTAALGAIYPVGSIYINATSSSNPSSLLGFGTWTAFGAGRVMVGLDAGNAAFDTAEETGGSADAITVSHTHTATSTSTVTDPGHVHDVSWTTGAGGSEAQNTWGDLGFSGGNDQVSNTKPNAALSKVTGITVATATTNASTGSSGTNANLQPYITVRMWKRTA